MDSAAANSSIIERMIRASRLEEQLYEEVEHDPAATQQAAIVVVGTSIAAGIGSIAAGPQWIPVVAVFSLVSWAVYAWLTYFIGTRLSPVRRPALVGVSWRGRSATPTRRVRC